MPDFKAHIKDGRLIVSDLPQPYVYTYSYTDSVYKLIVNTVATNTIMIPDVLDTRKENGALITSSTFSLYDASSGETLVDTWAGLEETQFTKADVLGFAQKLQGWGILAAEAVIILVFFIVSFIATCLHLLFVSFITFLIARSQKTGWKFGELYTVGLFALTLPTLIDTIGYWLDLSLAPISTIVVLVIMFGMIYSKDTPTETPNDSSSAS